jgi:hypothetical protein
MRSANADQLAAHYARLSDEALLEINPDDLTETARACYERELESRNLTGAGEPGYEDAGEDDSDVDEDWLEHAACACSFNAGPGYDTAPDAARARDVLLAAGIPCQLSIVSPDRRDPNAPHFDEYRVLVPASLNLKAMSVLDKEIFNEEMQADWKTHFADLSDEELEQLKPSVICAGLLDRVERLTRVYNEEVARRRG